MKSLTAIILTVALLSSGCVRGEEKTLQGTVEILPRKLAGTWIVKSGGEQRLVTVTPETRIEGGGTLKGAFIEVTGQADGNYLLASDIKVYPSAVSIAQGERSR